MELYPTRSCVNGTSSLELFLLSGIKMEAVDLSEPAPAMVDHGNMTFQSDRTSTVS